MTASRPLTGLVVPMFSEAAALFGRRRWQVADGRRVLRQQAPGGPLLCAVSQPGPQNARAAARWLVRGGARRLAVCGVAGGLHPALRPGDLVVADRLADLDAAPPAIIRAGAKCACRVQARLSAAGVRVYRGPVASRRKIVPGTREKAGLYRRWHALAVDMESAAVAAVAVQAGRPLLVLRAICDPLQHTLPADLLETLDVHGRILPAQLASGLLHRPQLAADLLHLGRSFARAMQALKRAWRLVERI